MAWLATDKDSTEWIYRSKPYRTEVGCWFGNDLCAIHIPNGSIKRFIGKELSWDDEPVEIK